MKILAIDPGNVYSAYCVIDDETLEPVEFDKIENYALLEKISKMCDELVFTYSAIEMVASYGMSVGKEVFETCRWIGRFYERIFYESGFEPDLVYRKDEKMHICHSMRAKDSNIRRALIDRFAKHDMKNGKGTKSNPDWFYGFKADCWAAYAVGVTYIENELKNKNRVKNP